MFLLEILLGLLSFIILVFCWKAIIITTPRHEVGKDWSIL